MKAVWPDDTPERSYPTLSPNAEMKMVVIQHIFQITSLIQSGVQAEGQCNSWNPEQDRSSTKIIVNSSSNKYDLWSQGLLKISFDSVFVLTPSFCADFFLSLFAMVFFILIQEI